MFQEKPLPKFDNFKSKELKELFSSEDHEELRNLRQKQIEGEYGENDRSRLIELMRKEKISAGRDLDINKKERYLELTKEQTESTHWTPEKSEELIGLQKIVDSSK